MKKNEQKACKTFPLEIEDTLHKALKYKAIEANQTLHAFIIDALAAKVQEEPSKYTVSHHHAETPSEKKK